MFKSKLRIIIQIILCIMASILGGCILMIMVYHLPTEEMSNNIARSSSLFDNEGIYPEWARGYKETRLDNWSEAYILCSAIYPVKNPVSDAMRNPIIEYKDEQLTLSLTLQANKVEGETFEREYGRYWHGSLIILKPLLMFFDVSDIRIMNMILQLGLISIIIITLVEQGYKKMLIPFFVTIIILNPITMPMSFKFSTEYLITLVASVFVLKYHNKLKSNNGYLYCFCIIGCLTSFFTMLSFPVITLGIPLIFYLLIDKSSWKKKIYDEIILSAVWGLGYGMMWLGKWTLATILTKENYFVNAFLQAKKYTNTDLINDPTAWDRIIKNVMMIMRWPYVILIFVIVLTSIISFVRRRNDFNIVEIIKIKIPYMILFFYPFVIYIILGNDYSYTHYWFSYRQLAVSICAVLCVLGNYENDRIKPIR